MTVQTDFLERCKALNLHDGKLSDWLDEIESLRQQLGAMEDKYLVEKGMRRLASAEAESLRQQLAECQANLITIRVAASPFTSTDVVDETSGTVDLMEVLREALAIQPDNAALKDEWRFK